MYFLIRIQINYIYPFTMHATSSVSHYESKCMIYLFILLLRSSVFSCILYAVMMNQLCPFFVIVLLLIMLRNGSEVMLWKKRQSSKTLLFVPYLFLPSAHLLNHTQLPRESSTSFQHAAALSLRVCRGSQSPPSAEAFACRCVQAHICAHLHPAYCFTRYSRLTDDYCCSR